MSCGHALVRFLFSRVELALGVHVAAVMLLRGLAE